MPDRITDQTYLEFYLQYDPKLTYTQLVWHYVETWIWLTQIFVASTLKSISACLLHLTIVLVTGFVNRLTSSYHEDEIAIFIFYRWLHSPRSQIINLFVNKASSALLQLPHKSHAISWFATVVFLSLRTGHSAAAAVMWRTTQRKSFAPSRMSRRRMIIGFCFSRWWHDHPHSPSPPRACCSKRRGCLCNANSRDETRRSGVAH